MVKLGLRTKRLIIQLLNLQNFSLELERLSNYSHSWGAGAREDTVMKFCDGSQQIQTSVKGGCRRSYGSHRTHQSKDTVP